MVTRKEATVWQICDKLHSENRAPTIRLVGDALESNQQPRGSHRDVAQYIRSWRASRGFSMPTQPDLPIFHNNDLDAFKEQLVKDILKELKAGMTTPHEENEPSLFWQQKLEALELDCKALEVARQDAEEQCAHLAAALSLSETRIRDKENEIAEVQQLVLKQDKDLMLAHQKIHKLVHEMKRIRDALGQV